VHVIDIAEDERQRQHVGGGHDLAHRAHVEVADGNGTGAQLLDGVGLGAQHTTRINLRLDAALGGGGDILGKALERGHVRVALGVDRPSAPGLGHGGGGKQRERKRGSGHTKHGVVLPDSRQSRVCLSDI